MPGVDFPELLGWVHSYPVVWLMVALGGVGFFSSPLGWWLVGNLDVLLEA